MGRREQARAATREEILAAAWMLAGEHGLGGMSLRELGRAVGMRAPSLYSYFDSKHAIYDAMFAQGAARARDEATALLRAFEADGVEDPVELLRRGARWYVAFCQADPVRYRLLYQRPVPDFEPSPEAYKPAVESLELLGEQLARAGVDDPAMLDLWTGVIAGLASQQMSNDPTGDRWVRLVDDAVDMFLAHALDREERE